MKLIFAFGDQNLWITVLFKLNMLLKISKIVDRIYKNNVFIPYIELIPIYYNLAILINIISQYSKVKILFLYLTIN